MIRPPPLQLKREFLISWSPKHALMIILYLLLILLLVDNRFPREYIVFFA